MGYGNFLNWTGQHHHLLNLTGRHKCFLKSTCAYRNPPQPTPVKVFTLAPIILLMKVDFFKMNANCMGQAHKIGNILGGRVKVTKVF